MQKEEGRMKKNLPPTFSISFHFCILPFFLDLMPGQGVEKDHFKGTGKLHCPKTRHGFLIERSFFTMFRVRRTEGDPAADADIIEHL